MKYYDNANIENVEMIKKWSNLSIERVTTCPMCGAHESRILIESVFDWLFKVSSDSWNFVECENCKSIYLNERPNEESISIAYSNYYTHSDKKSSPINIIKENLKDIIRGGKVYKKRNSKKKSRALGLFLGRLGLLQRTFLDDISSQENGRIMDVGCGSGHLLSRLESDKWEKFGIELDKNAVSNARGKGIKVFHGSYSVLQEQAESYDVIVCSHVIEHVYRPLELLDLIVGALKQSGEAWIQWPNPLADGLTRFGKYWRGLEAPRHLCLMSKESVITYLSNRFGGLISVNDTSDEWKKAAIYMNLSSRSMQNGDEGAFSKIEHILEILRYWHYCKCIKNSELCTLVVKKLK